MLGYSPFPMNLGIHQLGYVFTAWGVLLAADTLVIAIFTTSRVTLIVAVILSGMFLGLNNTLTTQAVMLVSPVERSVASAAYGFVRFIGGGLAPYFAARMAADLNVHVPFYVATAAIVLAVGVLATGHSLLTQAEQRAEEAAAPEPAQPLAPAAMAGNGRAPGGGCRDTGAGGTPPARCRSCRPESAGKPRTTGRRSPASGWPAPGEPRASRRNGGQPWLTHRQSPRPPAVRQPAGRSR